MFCPQCGAEYRPGFTRCYDCQVDLVEQPPPRKPRRRPRDKSEASPSVQLLKPVCIFRSGDPGRIAVAQSILRSAEVPFVVLNEAVQDMVGLGRFPAGFNIALGPVKIMVSESDAEDARLLVEDPERVGQTAGEDGTELE
jgi:Putative prokaryotic signal transducing protein